MNRNVPSFADSNPATASRPPLHPREEERLASVMALLRGNEGPDALMETYARRAAELCQSSTGLVTLLGEREQRFIACIGMEGDSTERDSAFCAYTILEQEPMVVEDARLDARFRNNPYVVGDPHIRFYAGAPLFDRSGLPLGSLCVVDSEPRAISSKRLLALQDLARAASVALEARRVLSQFVPQDRLEEARSQLDSVFEKFAAK